MPTVSVTKLTQDNNEIDSQITEIEGKMGETLYDQLHSAGHELPHGCLAGSCGSCGILILEGEEFLKRPSAVEADTTNDLIESKKIITNKENWTCRLSCRAKIETEGNIKIGIVTRS